ncbi:MAG: sel1 repeat family protein [Oscillospiraceae bacterium]|nr:sel1 repeat family protein [Oscillospiraceae bacterium]
MNNNLNPSIIEKVAQLRDEIMQNYFLMQMTLSYGDDWKTELAEKVTSHCASSNRNQPGGSREAQEQPSAPPRSTYTTLYYNVIRPFGADKIQIADLDISIICALVLWDFKTDFELDSHYYHYIDRIRTDRNTRQHFANHAYVLRARADAATALVNLRKFLEYLKSAQWRHPNASAFADKYLEKIDAHDAELFNDTAPSGPDYKALSFQELRDRAAEFDHEAELEMAIRLDSGSEDNEYGSATAIELFKKAADAGIAEAKARLAHSMLKKSTATRAEIKEAFALLAEADRLDCPHAHFVYGVVAFDGLGGEEKNKAAAYKEFKKGADKGSVEAKLFALYCEATENDCGKMSLANLSRIEGLATDTDSGYALNFAGWCYNKNGRFEDAAELYQKAAKKGYTSAESNLGTLYLLGRGVEKNPEKAFQLFQSAADKGNTGAEYRLALCYEKGWGVEPCEDAAVEYYKKSADKGFTKAEYSLGCLYYERGETHMYMRSLISNEESRKSTEAEGKKYYAMAFSYLKRASDKGHLEAQFWLAECYRCGFGTKRDAAAALPLYKKVALAEGDFASSAKRELFSILCKDNNYAKAEEISIKHKWFNELTEEYLFSIRSNDKAGYNRVITWLNKAQAAGYADAAKKRAEAEMRFSGSCFPFSINFPK